MVRLKKHNGVDYILVDTDIIVYDGEEVSTIVPVHVQVRLKDLSEKDQKAVYRYSSLFFDRTLTINKPKVKEKKGWFSRWFN
jgi:hypothetical protein